MVIYFIRLSGGPGNSAVVGIPARYTTCMGIAEFLTAGSPVQQPGNISVFTSFCIIKIIINYTQLYIANMTKTVSLSDEAYERMKHWKKENESFSSVVMRYLPDTRPFKEVLKEYEKDRKGLTDEEADQMLKDIE